jgi:hypothetical protein
MRGKSTFDQAVRHTCANKHSIEGLARLKSKISARDTGEKLVLTTSREAGELTPV